jgi:hypothetical protein
LSEISTRFRAAKLAAREAARDPEPEEPAEPESEARARQKIIDEAKKYGATLEKPDAKGGLPASMVLDCFRKCRYRCKRCGSRKDIGPHHIGGIPESPRLSRLGHQNKQSNLTILCARCHDAVHEEARDEGVDSSQVLPEGDVGTKRDRGDKPVAREEE